MLSQQRSAKRAETGTSDQSEEELCRDLGFDQKRRNLCRSPEGH